MITDGYSLLYFACYIAITTIYGWYMKHTGFINGINQTLITLGAVKSKAIQDAIKALSKEQNK